MVPREFSRVGKYQLAAFWMELRRRGEGSSRGSGYSMDSCNGCSASDNGESINSGDDAERRGDDDEDFEDLRGGACGGGGGGG